VITEQERKRLKGGEGNKSYLPFQVIHSGRQTMKVILIKVFECYFEFLNCRGWSSPNLQSLMQICRGFDKNAELLGKKQRFGKICRVFIKNAEIGWKSLSCV